MRLSGRRCQAIKPTVCEAPADQQDERRVRRVVRVLVRPQDQDERESARRGRRAAGPKPHAEALGPRHPISALRRAPESSPLGMKPRAPLSCTSGPKSEPSRLETSTIFAPEPFEVTFDADLEPVHVGQLDVEEHDLRVKLVDRR